MADIEHTAVTPAADSAAPAVVAPVETPAPVVSDSPAASGLPTETPSVEVAKTEAPAAETPVAENILGDEAPKKTENVKPADKVAEVKTPEGEKKPEAKADTKEKPVEGTKSETPPELPVELPKYEAFKLPENYSADPETMDAFTKALGEIEIKNGKLDHASMQETGQKLIDLGTKAVTDSITRLNDYYVNFHETQKKTWFDNALKDPQLGNGSEDKFREITGNLRTAIDEFGGSETQRQEFRQLMKDTGVGNHPALLRMLNNMQQKINKFTTEADNGNGGNNRIVPGQRPAPSKVKPHQLFYTGGGAA